MIIIIIISNSSSSIIIIVIIVTIIINIIINIVMQAWILTCGVTNVTEPNSLRASCPFLQTLFLPRSWFPETTQVAAPVVQCRQCYSSSW